MNVRHRPTGICRPFRLNFQIWTSKSTSHLTDVRRRRICTLKKSSQWHKRSWVKGDCWKYWFCNQNTHSPQSRRRAGNSVCQSSDYSLSLFVLWTSQTPVGRVSNSRSAYGWDPSWTSAPEMSRLQPKFSPGKCLRPVWWHRYLSGTASGESIHQCVNGTSKIIFRQSLQRYLVNSGWERPHRSSELNWRQHRNRQWSREARGISKYDYRGQTRGSFWRRRVECFWTASWMYYHFSHQTWSRSTR